MIIEFLKVYGVFIGLAALVVFMGATLYACISKVRRLENAVDALKKEVLEKIDETNRTISEEQKKERRLLNESMSNLSESVTRAVFSVKAENKKGE